MLELARPLAATALAVALWGASVSVAQQPHVEAGLLTCDVEGGTGFVFGSTKHLRCIYDKAGRRERYAGTISKFGVDLGITAKGALAWAVLAPTINVPIGALKGSYVGATGEATVGVGVGANALVGGSGSLTLQPVSVGGQQGLNVAVGVAALELRYLGDRD